MQTISSEKLVFRELMSQFEAHIYGLEMPIVEVTPCINCDGYEWTVALFYKDNGALKNFHFFVPKPVDLIAAWRSVEILRRLSARKSYVLNHQSLERAYLLAQRGVEVSPIDLVEDDRRRLGRRAYREVMGLSVPSEIYKAILAWQNTYVPPVLSSITDEVREGTIPWLPGFADAGVEHPRDIEERARVRKKIVHMHRREIDSYFHEFPVSDREGAEEHIHDALVSLVTEGASYVHSPMERVAIAALLGCTARFEESLVMKFMLEGSEKNAKRVSHFASLFQNTMKWLARGYKPAGRFFKEQGVSPERARALLTMAAAKHPVVRTFVH